MGRRLNLAPGYAAAKAGLYGLMLHCALAMQEYNITANCIFPRASSRLSDESPANVGRIARGELQPFEKKSRVVPGAELDPANVTPACVYLASERAAWVSGCAFHGFGDQIRLLGKPQIQKTLAWQESPWDIDKPFTRFKPVFGPCIKQLPQATPRENPGWTPGRSPPEQPDCFQIGWVFVGFEGRTRRNHVGRGLKEESICSSGTLPSNPGSTPSSTRRLRRAAPPCTATPTWTSPTATTTRPPARSSITATSTRSSTRKKWASTRSCSTSTTAPPSACRASQT